MHRWNLCHKHKVPSTNQYAKDALCQEYDVIWTTNQTHGKGRQKQDWESPQGHLAFTIILPFPEKFNDLAKLPLQTCSTLHHTLLQHFDQTTHQFQIKWPNDLYANHKKCAGILCEADHQNKKVYVGVGINLNNTITSLSAKLQTTATCLRNETTPSLNPEYFLNHFLENWNLELSAPSTQQWLYHNQLIDITDQNKALKGRFLDLGCHGELILLESSGCIRPVLNGTLRKA